MPQPSPMFLQKPFSLAHARSMFGGSDPKKLALLLKNMPFNYGYVETEFGGAIVAADWTTAVTAGGGPTAFAYAAVRGGVAQGATGTTDNDATAIYRAQTFLDPGDFPFMIIRWTVNTITGFSFEVGFSDPKTDEALPGVTDVDGPTIGNGATDILCVHMDTDQTLTTASLVGDGTTGAAAKTDIGTYTPSAAVPQTMIIGLRPNIGFCAIWDGDGSVGNIIYSVSNGPDTGVLVRPYALFRTRNTASKTINIDYIGFGWERSMTL